MTCWCFDGPASLSSSAQLRGPHHSSLCERWMPGYVEVGAADAVPAASLSSLVVKLATAPEHAPLRRVLAEVLAAVVRAIVSPPRRPVRVARRARRRAARALRRGSSAS